MAKRFDPSVRNRLRFAWDFIRMGEWRLAWVSLFSKS